MKRLIFVFAIAFGLTAQQGNEPENHTITVERLMRYHDSGQYELGIREVASAAHAYVEARVTGAPKADKLAAVFDIDETTLSGWDAMAGCGFCAYKIQLKEFSNAHEPAIAPVLELYNFAKAQGVAVFFVTGRQEALREMTANNLKEAGYAGWAGLLMQVDGNKDPAGIVKPRSRQEIVKRGYTVILNIGDQASDLTGCCAERTFKVPNPFYQLP